ncbi:MAG: T9SS type A sorting domain-containing protein, partial [Bacteroidetes bacterium]|nr:T9SS type A sorting domain-containing protein [Bacteroidota bacterium]
KLIILFVMFLTGMLSAQNWTAVKETNINVANAQSVDIFTNGYGNHIIVRLSNSLLYYNMDVNGNAGTPVTLESSAVVSPSITGDANNIYAVYRKSNEAFIRTKYSSDGGSTWQYLTNLNNQNANSIESVYSNGKLHITYAVSNIVYYSRFENQNWTTPFTVSTGENGFLPRIIAWYDGQNEFVYFLYKKQSTNIGKWRRYNAGNNTWGTLYEGFNLFNVLDSFPAGLRVTSSRIIIYYSYYAEGPFGNEYFFNWFVRNNSNNDLINGGTPNVDNLTGIIYSTITTDEKSHTAFYYAPIAGEGGGNELGIWRSNSDDGYPTDLIFDYTLDPQFPSRLNISSASNDVYVIWKDNIGGNNLRTKYDDQNPLAPTNFTGTNYNNRPKLTWDKIEPDIEYFEIWRRFNAPGYPGGWNLLTTTTSTSFIDNEIWLGGSSVGSVLYKIKSKDIGNHFSSYTNVVFFKFSGINKIASRVVLFDFVLKNNHPNPFNPSTQIIYSLAQDADVMLKVYDMLGTEVAKLVSETQTAGIHEINFNAENLSSGVYIYRITATNNGRILFTDSKQMILLR